VTPAISVVIPCRDRLRLLHRALDSLDRQSMADFETIIADDGSIGDVRAVAAAFPRLAVRVVATGGGGANVARNLGTDAARAAYVAYLWKRLRPPRKCHLANRRCHARQHAL